MELKFDASGVQALIRGGLRVADKGGLIVEEVRQGYARIRLPYRDSMLRPGNVVSGPALFTAADSAMYALVLSHVGPALMAVTANMNLTFLNKALPGDVIGAAHLLKLGRRLVVMNVDLSTSAEPARIVAHVTGSYALPAS
ncbi:MAG: PaaI family thioesterase [Sinimarinibacterium sp.]